MAAKTIRTRNNLSSVAIDENSKRKPPDVIDKSRSSEFKFLPIENEFVGNGDKDYSAFESPQSQSTPKSKTHRRSKSGTRIAGVTSSLSLSNDHFYEELEDYVRVMANSRGTDSGVGSPAEIDVWTQLQQKESDLLLAAELGKALLDKNEELKKEQEKLAEDYSKKVEELEQEKHILRRRMDQSEGEYEARIVELQNDIRELSSKVDLRENNVKQSDREKTSLIAELTAQNNRLTSQLKEASNVEAQLTAQLQGLKDQCSLRKSSLQDHVSSLDALKEELSLVCDKKTELERRLQLTTGDKDELAAQLDEATDRIMALERQLKEQEMLYQNTLKELERLQRSHDTLAERLGGADGPDGAGTGARSLHAELESPHGDEGLPNAEAPEDWLQREAMQVYKQLRSLVLQLQSTHDDDSGLHSDLSLTSLDSPSLCGALPPGALLAACADACAAACVLDEGALGAARDALAAHSRRAADRERQLDERNETIADLQTKLSVAEVELRSASEQSTRALADASCSTLARDEAVARARAERDEAAERKKEAEVSLARARVELMQANSQLLEAARQKIELGQQLEQWQTDMQELIDDQMKRKLTSQEKKRKLPGNNNTPIAPARTTAGRLLGFFQR